jgi:hypothetical protein
VTPLDDQNTLNLGAGGKSIKRIDFMVAIIDIDSHVRRKRH